MTEDKEHSFTNLDAARFFGYNIFQRYWYAIKRILFYRKEKVLCIRLKNYWESSLPLTDFERGFLLSIIEKWNKAELLSDDMCRMLEVMIHDREYWLKRKNSPW